MGLYTRFHRNFKMLTENLIFLASIKLLTGAPIHESVYPIALLCVYYPIQ